MSTPQDRLATIEHAWSMFDEDDGPPVSDVRWLIAEVKRLRAELARRPPIFSVDDTEGIQRQLNGHS